MENKVQKTKKNVIIKVEKNSIAQELGIEPGDILVSINSQEVLDVFDYRYLIADEYIEMCIETADGQLCRAEIEKDEDEDIGIVFESGLMDQAKSCTNRCIFCFIDQLPPNMRQTLYFKDDDSRLSFLQGNYVTLTNMKKEDIDRIIYYHLSPINISVHTTNLQLRKKMLHNKNADKILDLMRQLADAGIEMNLQVVLCKGINDKEELNQTIRDCSSFFPHAKSMSVVPIGLTKYRENLYPLEPFSKEEALEVIQQIEAWQKILLEKFQTRFVFVSDEFYLKAEKELPDTSFYEDFSQYENGVGMISLLRQEFQQELGKLGKKDISPKVISMATGKAAFFLIKELAYQFMEKYPQVQVHVYEIINHFFGPEITVSGLLTGRDIIQQLKNKPLGEYLILPDSLLRNGEQVLLDDVTLTDISNCLNVPIVTAFNSGKSLIEALTKINDR